MINELFSGMKKILFVQKAFLKILSSHRRLPRSTNDLLQRRRNLLRARTLQSHQFSPQSKVPNDTWTLPHASNTRNCSLDSFSSLVSKARSKTPKSLCTSNYSVVLDSVDVEYSKIDITTSLDFGRRYHIVSSKVVGSKDFAYSEDAASS